MRLRFFQLFFLFTLINSCLCIGNVIKEFLMFNIAGHPVLHKDSQWDFDPDIGARRSTQYQELNGKYGSKAIERLGLGIDGFHEMRLLEQRAKDEGHLDGATEQ